MNASLESSSGLFRLLAIALLLCTIASIRTLAQTHAAEAEAVGKYTGPGSCASTSCHGSILPRTENDVLQNEYSTWIVKDKHSKAYNALTGPIGEQIAKNLRLGKAETEKKCLVCHSLNPPVAGRSRSFDPSEGVSCESCHGPASGWLSVHMEQDAKYEKSVRLGMNDMRDPAARTKTCLGCHLGASDQYVDHEMIAAGHPMLQFELDSFSAVMPRHWKEAATPLDPARSDPLDEVRELTVGQAIDLSKSLELLATRAGGKVWPEYSEIQCEACHHSLTPPEQSWRQKRGYLGRRPGNPPWNASRYTVFREIAHALDGTDADQLDSDLAQVSKLMSTLDPDPAAVASAATSSAHTADALAAKMKTASYDPALTLRLLQRISGDAEGISAEGEQSAAEAAMVVQSLFVAYGREQKLQNLAEVSAAITNLFEQLQNLSTYDPARFAEQMRRVNALLR